MIQKTVNAVFLLRDGFTGRLIADSAVRFFLDDAVCRPVVKQDGFIVLTGLLPGPHTLRVERRGYRPEMAAFIPEPGKLTEDVILLKPDSGYRFPEGILHVRIQILRGKKPGAALEVMIGMSGKSPVKLAQDPSESLSDRIRVFYSKNSGGLPVPGRFLAADKKSPEVLFIRSVQDGAAANLKKPMTASHPRGTELIPVQAYTTDEQGNLDLIFRNTGRMAVFAGGKLFFEELMTDGQSVILQLEG